MTAAVLAGAFPVPATAGSGSGPTAATDPPEPGPADRLERDLRRMALLQRRAVLARVRRRRGGTGTARLQA